jgi:hypothetical protein
MAMAVKQKDLKLSSSSKFTSISREVVQGIHTVLRGDDSNPSRTINILASNISVQSSAGSLTLMISRTFGEAVESEGYVLRWIAISQAYDLTYLSHTFE